MTVEGLIRLLSAFPPDMEVVVQSYEEGFDPVTHAQEIPVRQVEDKPWYVGLYEETEDKGTPVLAVLSRLNRSEKKEAPK